MKLRARKKRSSKAYDLAFAYERDYGNCAQATLKALLDAGIRTIINLMEETETDHQGAAFEGYEDTIRILAEERRLTVECFRIPIRDVDVPPSTLMASILDKIDHSLAQKKPVYVHCWGGKGRTGTVVGCWLARHGRATGDEALGLIRELRKNDPTGSQPSPETERQRRMVRAWKIGE